MSKSTMLVSKYTKSKSTCFQDHRARMFPQMLHYSSL